MASATAPPANPAIDCLFAAPVKAWTAEVAAVALTPGAEETQLAGTWTWPSEIWVSAQVGLGAGEELATGAGVTSLASVDTGAADGTGAGEDAGAGVDTSTGATVGTIAGTELMMEEQLRGTWG